MSNKQNNIKLFGLPEARAVLALTMVIEKFYIIFAFRNFFVSTVSPPEPLKI